MFARHQKPTATIVIDGSALLFGDALTIDHFWSAGDTATEQLQRAAVLAVNTPADAIDHALAATATNRRHVPLREFAFTHQHGMSGALWYAGAHYTLAVKGLPERILACCDVTENEREATTLEIQKLSARGESIITIAQATLPHAITSLSELAGKRQLTFMGLVSFTDTIPGDIRELIRQVTLRGVSLRLLTGTHQQTAFAIAKQLGIATRPSDVRDARQLHVAPHVIQAATVFARALPEHKAQIIASLRHMNDSVIVASTKEDLKAALRAQLPRRKG